MKRMYWRPVRIPQWQLLSLCLLTVAAYVGVEHVAHAPCAEQRREMLEASMRAARCMAAVKEEKQRRGIQIDPRFDPPESGMIGVWMSPVTSAYGNLHAKQTSVNPNFAAVIVRLLKDAGTRRGEAIAVALSGSFPALNVCVYAAADELGLKPIVISSVSASQWGANNPELLWIDMEKLLYDRGLISGRSVAASLGGRNDEGIGMTVEGTRLLSNAIQRHGLISLHSPTYDQNVQDRITVYERFASGDRIAAYVNVGGGMASVGTADDKRRFAPGLVEDGADIEPELASVMAHYSGKPVPVIHLSQIHVLARKFGMPWRPSETPRPGDGLVYHLGQKSRIRAGIALAFVFAAFAWAVGRSSRRIGKRMYQSVLTDKQAIAEPKND